MVRSQEIDALGENVDELTARSAMDSVIGNVARAIRKLAKAGIESFVITADHGHQFSIRKDDDMKIDNPGGDTVELHRRCWIGHGGSDAPRHRARQRLRAGLRHRPGLRLPHWAGRVQGRWRPEFPPRQRQPAGVGDPGAQPAHSFPGHAPQAQLGPTVQLYGLPEAITNRTFGVRLLLAGDALRGR